MSNRLVSILKEYSPQVEVYSIDESFLLLNGMAGQWNNFTEMGQAIRSHVMKWTNLPVCAGFGGTKTLAKAANHIAKKRRSFNGVCDLSSMPYDEVNAIFSEIDASEIWGIGRKISERLRAMKINTVQDLKLASPKAMRKHFGVVVERTCNELNGISCIDLEEIAPPRKQIVSSRSFGTTVMTIREIEESISMYMARASEKLRGQKSLCGAVHVFVQTDRFREDQPQYNNGVTLPLPEPSDDLRVLTGVATQGLKRIFKPGFKYKKAGVMLMDLSEGGVRQTSLFSDEQENVNAPALMNALDALNSRYGRDTVKLGSALGLGRWNAKFESRTPHFTTDWDELPNAK